MDMLWRLINCGIIIIIITNPSELDLVAMVCVCVIFCSTGRCTLMRMAT